MPLTVEKRDGGPAKAIITAMIVDKTVLSTLAPKWDPQLFDARWCNLVGGWCVRYFNKYGRPPRADIEELYQEWLGKKERDKDTAELAARFLQGLSDDYARLRKSINPQYVIDQAGVYFNKVRLKRLGEEIVELLANGEVDKADELRQSFQRVEVGQGSYFDPTDDDAGIEDALNFEADVLIRYPDGAGNFFGDSLEREGLISFLAPEKTGKTWWLMDLAIRGAEQGNKVAFFAVGDMTKRQLRRRYLSRINKRPVKAKPARVPTYLELEGSEPEVTHEETEYAEPMDVEKAKAKAKRAKEGWGGGEMRISVYPNSTISVPEIKAILQDWARHGWAADVVVIDYADILKPINGAAETRDQINATWRALSALRQEMKCLVVTATQSNADGYKTEVLGKGNFSGDKRKNAEVTGMIGINVNKEDKKKGLARLNWVALREGEFTESQCLYVAGCLAIGNPCILSRF